MINFTFIVPVYNCEKYLRNCIESLLAQTMDNFEILLIDDGSTDASRFICDEYAESYHNIRTIHKKNGGVSSARNVGIDNTKTEYLAFIDCDDFIECSFLWKMRKIIEDSHPNLIISGLFFDYYRKNKLVQTIKLGIAEWKMMPLDFIVKNIRMLFQRNLLSSSCAKIYSTELLNKWNIRFDENIVLYEDLQFVIEYLRRCDSVYFQPSAYYHYRIILEDNRYFARISDGNQINYMLKSINKSLEKLTYNVISEKNVDDLLPCLQIEFEIFVQVLNHLLSMDCFQKSKLEQTIKKVQAMSEYQKFFELGTTDSQFMTKEMQLIHRHAVYRLRFRMFYKRNRAIIIKALKRIKNVL